MRKLLSAGITSALMVSGVVLAPSASAITWPICNQVSQPTMTDPLITAEGVRFYWAGGSQPTQDYFVWLNRKVGGKWVGGSFVQGLGKGTTHFEKWIDGNGTRSDALYLAPFIYCEGDIVGPNQTVLYSEWQALDAQRQAEEQAAIDALVAAQLAEQQQAAASVPQPTANSKKKRSECVNKKTREIKIFAMKRCPIGWKKF